MESKKYSHQELAEADKSSRLNRRQFLKIGSAGAVIGAMELVNSPAKLAADAANETIQKDVVEEHSRFPITISSDYKPFPQKNTVFSQAVGGTHKTLGPLARTFERYECDDSKPGFTRIDWALHHSTWAIEHSATPGSKFGTPNAGWYGWKQKTNKERESFRDLNYVYDEKYQFKSKKEAADSIKRAARLFGAELVGITHRNKKWDYAKHYNPMTHEEISWDQFPFEPKSVLFQEVPIPGEKKLPKKLLQNWATTVFPERACLSPPNNLTFPRSNFIVPLRRPPPSSIGLCARGRKNTYFFFKRPF